MLSKKVNEKIGITLSIEGVNDNNHFRRNVSKQSNEKSLSSSDKIKSKCSCPNCNNIISTKVVNTELKPFNDMGPNDNKESKLPNNMDDLKKKLEEGGLTYFYGADKGVIVCFKPPDENFPEYVPSTLKEIDCKGNIFLASNEIEMIALKKSVERMYSSTDVDINENNPSIETDSKINDKPFAINSNKKISNKEIDELNTVSTCEEALMSKLSKLSEMFNEREKMEKEIKKNESMLKKARDRSKNNYKNNKINDIIKNAPVISNNDTMNEIIKEKSQKEEQTFTCPSCLMNMKLWIDSTKRISVTCTNNCKHVYHTRCWNELFKSIQHLKTAKGYPCSTSNCEGYYNVVERFKCMSDGSFRIIKSELYSAKTINQEYVNNNVLENKIKDNIRNEMKDNVKNDFKSETKNNVKNNKEENNQIKQKKLIVKEYNPSYRCEDIKSYIPSDEFLERNESSLKKKKAKRAAKLERQQARQNEREHPVNIQIDVVNEGRTSLFTSTVVTPTLNNDVEELVSQIIAPPDTLSIKSVEYKLMDQIVEKEINRMKLAHEEAVRPSYREINNQNDLSIENDGHFLCEVCHKECIDIVFFPCKHCVVCAKCSNYYSQCLICSKEIGHRMSLSNNPWLLKYFSH